jgi:hypothetical protein
MTLFGIALRLKWRWFVRKTSCNDDARPMAVLASIAIPERLVDDEWRSKLFPDRPSDV